MSVEEIKNTGDAQARLEAYFDVADMQEGELAKLTQLLDFLGNATRAEAFRDKLKAISKEIWTTYNRPEISAKTNRFTSAIVTVGATYGFASQDNVVFVGALGGAAFGQRLRDGVLWKDSFALDHGEFSHSYQWLAAGLEFGWGTGTAALYKNLPNMRSRVPLFAIDNAKLAFRRAPIWEYLVDCTNYSDERAGPGKRAPAVEAYFDRQLALFKANQLVDRYFVNEYLREFFAAELFQGGADKPWKPEYDSGPKRGDKQAEINAFLDRKPDTRARFVANQVARFALQNAITRGYPDGSFRSPNNVSYLVRAKSNWFINAYQIHRTGRRTHVDVSLYPAVDGDAAVAQAESGKLGVRGLQGAEALKAKFQAMDVPKLTNSGVQVEPATNVKLKSEEMKRGVRLATGNKPLPVRIPIPEATLDVRGRPAETFRSTNPIEGARHAQHQRYQGKAGYAELAPNVYARPADGRGDSTKTPGREVTYHKVTGTLHTTLNASISINK